MGASRSCKWVDSALQQRCGSHRSPSSVKIGKNWYCHFHSVLAAKREIGVCETRARNAIKPYKDELLAEACRLRLLYGK